jgi:ribosomal protein S5
MAFIQLGRTALMRHSIMATRVASYSSSAYHPTPAHLSAIAALSLHGGLGSHRLQHSRPSLSSSFTGASLAMAAAAGNAEVNVRAFSASSASPIMDGQLDSQFRRATDAELDAEETLRLSGRGPEKEEVLKAEPISWNDKDLSQVLTYRQLLKVGRHTKVMGGGRIFSVSALVLVGNGNGTAGFGYGKALTMQQAMQRANRDAEKNLITIDRFEDRTLSMGESRTKYKGAIVVVRNASRGRGLVCNSLIRQVVYCSFCGACASAPHSSLSLTPTHPHTHTHSLSLSCKLPVEL